MRFPSQPLVLLIFFFSFFPLFLTLESSSEESISTKEEGKMDRVKKYESMKVLRVGLKIGKYWITGLSKSIHECKFKGLVVLLRSSCVDVYSRLSSESLKGITNIFTLIPQHLR